MTAQLPFFSALPAAEFSPCRMWRYVLRRRWSEAPPVGFILLNPSTADEEQDDPTIRRCMGYARALGAGGITLGNIFAFRATDPRDMFRASDPVGPDNDAALLRIVEEVADRRIICGWGGHGVFMGRGAQVRVFLKAHGARLEALSVTGAGEPGHPLYLAAALRPRAI